MYETLSRKRIAPSKQSNQEGCGLGKIQDNYADRRGRKAFGQRLKTRWS